VGNGAFLHVSGLKWTIAGDKAQNVMVGGQPIDLAKPFKVVTNNFMASGGDGYAMLKPLPQEDTGFVDADALKDYVTKFDKIEPKLEGRLTITQ
jgi:5'-nucleotidase/UDP-sugar diphosphatase